MSYELVGVGMKLSLLLLFFAGLLSSCGTYPLGSELYSGEGNEITDSEIEAEDTSEAMSEINADAEDAEKEAGYTKAGIIVLASGVTCGLIRKCRVIADNLREKAVVVWKSGYKRSSEIAAEMKAKLTTELKKLRNAFSKSE